MAFLSLSLSLSVSSFREALVATELEMDTLKEKCANMQSQKNSKEKALREVTRMKGIITSQEKQVNNLN